MNAEDMQFPRLTYTSSVSDLSGVHDIFDGLLPDYKKRLGRQIPNRIAGLESIDGTPYDAWSPLDRRLLLGTFVEPSAAAITGAIAAARKAVPGWRRTPWQERVAMMRKFARVIGAKKAEMSAALVYQTGKTRPEALSETEETIELIEHYCRQMEVNDGFIDAVVKSGVAEQARVELKPFGVFAVIAPFNYPAALIANMTSAALVAGNTVVLKASPESGLTADIFVRAAEAAGLAPGTLNLLLGEEAGPRLVDELGVDGIAFTGSQSVGISILRKVAAGPFMRPVIGELGGKNSCYITSSADLDAAVEGVARSAFAFQGQKCSACSVAFVHSSVFDDFLSALTERSAQFKLGNTEDRACNCGPLINANAVERFEAAVAHAKTVGQVVSGGTRLTSGAYDHGCFVSPTIVTDIPYDDRLYRDELFAPFVVLRRYDDLSQAIEAGNAVVSGLTAGIFSTAEEEIDYFRDNAEAGTLYINRAAGATTGAWPGVQSLCGWKASGLTGKGGLGPHYLPQFMREQCVTRIVR